MIPERPTGGEKITVIAFTDARRPWWLRFFPRGFRHCFALVRDAGRWVVVNPMSHWTEISVLPEAADGADAQDVVRALAQKLSAPRFAPSPNPRGAPCRRPQGRRPARLAPRSGALQRRDRFRDLAAAPFSAKTDFKA